MFAPWALPAALVRGAAVLVPALRRRVVAECPVTWVPGWLALEAALRLWSRGRTDRQMAARFAVRAAVDQAAAWWLPPGLQALYAPTCAAQRSFARAQTAGVTTLLVHDLPLLRRLHEDLDRAAAAHPQCRFLRRYRAGHKQLQRQEAEYVLASGVLARGAFAAALLRERGLQVQPSPLFSGEPLPANAAPLPRSTSPGRRRLLLAGVAAARHGSVEALAVLAQDPAAELLIQGHEGVEPGELHHHPRVRPASRSEREHFEGVTAVIAPAWCEAYLNDIPRALGAGIPVVATPQAAGPWPVRALVPPGDADALLAALRRIT